MRLKKSIGRRLTRRLAESPPSLATFTVMVFPALTFR